MNIQESVEPRLLSLVIRSSRYGYVVFNGPKRLLDWGAGEIVSHDTGNAVGMKRVAFLFKYFPPAAVALRWSAGLKAFHRDRAITLAKFVTQEALGQKIPVLSINADSVERAFQSFQVHTKYDIAETLTVIFPELAWTLPPRRKSWQNERHMMIVFDAVATGFAYWTAKTG
jgi:hypothetical protein